MTFALLERWASLSDFCHRDCLYKCLRTRASSLSTSCGYVGGLPTSANKINHVPASLELAFHGKVWMKCSFLSRGGRSTQIMYLLDTNSMDRNPSREANNRSTGQEIPRHLISPIRTTFLANLIRLDIITPIWRGIQVIKFHRTLS